MFHMESTKLPVETGRSSPSTPLTPCETYASRSRHDVREILIRSGKAPGAKRWGRRGRSPAPPRLRTIRRGSRRRAGDPAGDGDEAGAVRLPELLHHAALQPLALRPRAVGGQNASSTWATTSSSVAGDSTLLSTSAANGL